MQTHETWFGLGQLCDGQSVGVKGGPGERMRFTTWNVGSMTGRACEMVEEG